MDDVQLVDAVTRLGTDRLERGDARAAAYACPHCGAATSVDFATFDHLLAAALHAGHASTPIDDAAAARFDHAHPPGPGQRVLDAACSGCGARFRILAHGGEQSRDGALQYLLDGVVEDTPTHAPAPVPAPGAASGASRTRVRRNVVILTLVIVAIGVGFLIPAVRAERQRAVLLTDGVLVTAQITDETLRRRAPASLDVTFETPDGARHEATFEVPMVSGWRAGDRTVEVIYDPSDPTVAVAATGGLRHPWMFLFAGIGLIVLGLTLGIRLWRRAEALPTSGS